MPRTATASKQSAGHGGRTVLVAAWSQAAMPGSESPDRQDKGTSKPMTQAALGAASAPTTTLSYSFLETNAVDTIIQLPTNSSNMTKLKLDKEFWGWVLL